MGRHCRRFESHKETQRRLGRVCFWTHTWFGVIRFGDDQPIDSKWKGHALLYSRYSVTIARKSEKGKWYWKRWSTSHRGVSKRTVLRRREIRRALNNLAKQDYDESFFIKPSSINRYHR